MRGGSFPLDFEKGENEMNKRELIEHINNTLFDNLKDTLFTEPTLSITENAKDNKVAITFETEQGGVIVGGMLKKFEKVTIPQFVADWYEENKDSFDYNLWEYLVGWEEQEPSDFKNWINNRNNAFQILVNMHQFGYTVEKEKRYFVKLKAVDQYLVRNEDENFLGFLQSRLKSKFTRKQLEQAGLGWVFDCPGIEIEEVE